MEIMNFIKQKVGMLMENQRKIKAQLIIECNVIIDDSLIDAISVQYSMPKSDQEAADQVLYAVINPKIVQIEHEKILWDGVASLEGRICDVTVSSV